MKTAGHALAPTPSARTALERLAAGGGGRAALRAKAVLALAGGGSVAETARALRVTEKTVRAARARFLSGGAGALSDRPRGGPEPHPALRVCPPPELAGWKDAGAHGRPPRARRRIETWVRDCAALGRVRPGARLPSRAWFRRAFHATPGLVQAAFDELAAQGFVRALPGVETRLARRLPFAGRYLLGILPKRDDESREGLDASLLAAARRQERRLGVRWDVCDIVPPSHPDYRPTLAKIAAQRYAGVLLRTEVRQKDDPGRHRWFASVDHVPICSCATKAPGEHAACDYGSHFSELVRPPRNAIEEVFADVRAAGCRRALVLGVESPEALSLATEAQIRAAATAAGVEIPRHFYQCASLLAPLQARRVSDLLFAHAEDSGIDAAVCLQDNFAPILCDALRDARREAGGGGLSEIKVFSLGSFPNELHCSLPVEWHGDDWDATLDAFVRWCDAIHAGDPAPPAPALVRR